MKQQLSEALAIADKHFAKGLALYLTGVGSPLYAAARLVERLLPRECEFVTGERHPDCNYSAHLYCNKCGWVKRPVCCIAGRVWDEGIVEAVAKALLDLDGQNLSGLIRSWAEERMAGYRTKAIAVLSALVELLTEKVET